MKRLIQIHVRKQVWKIKGRRIMGLTPSDCDEIVDWIMEGYPFQWRTRLWAVKHSEHNHYKDVHKWINS